MAYPNDPVLNQKARLVDSSQIQTKHVKDVIAKLHEVAGGQRDVRKGKKRRTLVGLAAPQIGVSLRIILVDTKVQANRTRYGSLECFINPEIIWRSKETADGREGCFSTGLVWGLVRRPIAIKVRALTPEGQIVEQVLEGFTARIMQHEMDHLDGIRFPDRIRADRKRHWVHAEEIDEYPKHIEHWPRICDQDRWERVKASTTPTQ
jgi:peptide deformylase